MTHDTRPTDLPATGQLGLQSIGHTGQAKTPLRVTFRVGGSSPITLDCSAASLQSFSAFRKVVADKLGIWLRHDCEDEHRARDAAEVWSDDVARAFESGRG